MSSYVALASDLSYEVLKRQRRDSEVSLTPRHESVQIGHARLDLDELFSTDEVVRDEGVPTVHVVAGQSLRHVGRGQR